MRNIFYILTVLCALTVGSGCKYAHARLRDAADCIAGSVTVGGGLMAEAQVTWLTRAGGGYLEGRRFAFYYGRPSAMDTMSFVVALGPIISAEVTSNETSTGFSGYMLGTVYGVPTATENGAHEPTKVNPFRAYHNGPLEDRVLCGSTFTDVGFTVHVFYVGVEFRIRLAEIVDFLFGLATIDFMGDDGLTEAKQEAQP